MNDTMSLVLATSILAIGGLGLYLYKDNSNDNEVEYNEDSLFSSMNFFGGSDDNEEELNEIEEIDDVVSEDSYDYKPKPKKGGKTKRARKTGGTKRRY